nr:RecName: Full=Unknown protein 1 [Solanum lycopersicum]
YEDAYALQYCPR